MRVCMVCPYDLGVFGGVQSQVFGLADALSSMGHEVKVVGPGRPADSFESVGRSLGIRANGSVAPIAPQPTSWRRTIRLLEDADVAHVHEPFVPGPSLACLLQTAVPVVGTFHQSGFAWPYRVAAPLVRQLGRRIAEPTAVSEAAAAMVEGPLGRPVEVLWNGVAPRPPFGRLETTGPTIVFVGRHERRKGLRVLLEALTELPADIRLWVIGEGPETSELHDRFSDPRIEWLGRVSDAERDRRVASADVYCAPNLGGESFGLVLAEAMASGVAVVASDLPAFRSVARPERGEAVLVPPGDAAALAQALSGVLGDPDRRESLSTAARDRAGDFSMERLSAAYESIYARALRSR
jgi:phosphatidyl-myo-inositol alpha-mannosyltransferase